jgi:hypothetical protein
MPSFALSPRYPISPTRCPPSTHSRGGAPPAAPPPTAGPPAAPDLFYGPWREIASILQTLTLIGGTADIRRSGAPSTSPPSQVALPLSIKSECPT